MLPAAARWYLAGIAVLALLCIAMQLSIQAHAQQQARALIQTWGERANVHIGDVRYHLLRNGLILRDIQIERGNDSIDIAQMLLRANPKLLTGNAPRIGEIDISGLSAEITHVGQADIWLHDRYLRQIWQAATLLTVHNGNIKLYVNNKDAPPLELSDISIRQRLQYAMRSIVGSARMQQATVNWQWDMAARQGSSAPQQAEQWLSKGWLKWQALDAEKLTASLALKQTTGRLSGGLTWSTNSPDDGRQASLNIRGDMQLDTGAGSKASHAHRLQYLANETNGRWQMDIEATAWPLDPWSDTLPKIGERQLISAQMNGKMHWQGRAGDWNINSDQGLLQDVTYAMPENSGSPAWYWSQINYKHAAIQTSKHQLQMAEVDMQDSRLVLQTKRIDTASYRPDNQASDAVAEVVIAKQKHIGKTKDAPWKINADIIRIKNMMLALAMPHGKVTLAGLDGQVRNPKGKALDFKLHTHEQQRTNDSTTSVGEARSEAPPQWSVRGKAEKNKQGQLNSANIRIQGRHIPVARLRPLLPLQDDADRPVKLTGVAEFKAAISVDQGIWQMQGKASVQNLNLSHGGDVVLADQLSIRFGPVGMGLDTQIIDSINTQGWQYIGALQPLPLHMAEHAEDDITSPNDAAWWVTTLRNNHIAITRLNLKNGQISVGQQQALWAEQVNIKVTNMQSDHWSEIAITGKVGGSDFHLQGQWQALSDVQRFRGDVDLEQAEPFFLHNWMVASGMPRLIQGRLSTSLHLEDGQAPDSYQGVVNVQLLQGLTETGLFTSDPMLARTGYSTSELLQRLEKSAGVIALQYDVSGLWSSKPLTLKQLGLSMQSAMHATASSGRWRASLTAGASKTQAAIVARIRLHGRERLSLNERHRLSKVIHKLLQHPEMLIELRPTWTGEELTQEMLQRIRRTQKLIERYMTYRKIDKRRIFPIWPTAADQVDEIGSVQVETKIAG
ncbi:MAG: hypothetical protein Q9M82_02220 [Mariprofundus sp.]|nr:hypothetical protein [Mariprofundus sp.]